MELSQSDKHMGGSNEIKENSSSDNDGYGVRKDARQATKMRFVVCTLGVLSLAMAQMNRGTMNLCITSMVHPSMLHNQDQKDQERALINKLAPNLSLKVSKTATKMDSLFSIDERGPTSPESMFDPSPNFLINNNQQVDTTIGGTLDNDQNKTEIVDRLVTIDLSTDDNDRFMWTVKQQSLLKGGFFYSYFFFMILGGRLSEIYGAKYVILIGILGSAIINLASPWMARQSFELLVTSRVLMGVMQSGVLPAMYALIAKWLTLSEAGIFAPMMKMNLRVGQLLASLVPGLIPRWSHAFHVVGLLGIIWSSLFVLLATSDPAENRWVNQLELDHINKKKRGPIVTEKSKLDAMSTAKTEPGDQADQSRGGSIPWLRILTSPSVIALIIVKFTYNLCPDFISIELPSYLKYAHQASRQRISAIQTGIFSIQVTLIVAGGWLAKEMIKRKPLGMTRTSVRRLNQGICSIGGGLVLVMISMNHWNLDVTALAFEVVSFLCIFAGGGETMAPYDLSEQYPATIMGIANSVANLSGIAITSLTGLILDNQATNTERWHKVICSVGVIEMLGGLVFVCIYKADLLKIESDRSAVDAELGGSCMETDTKNQSFETKERSKGQGLGDKMHKAPN